MAETTTKLLFKLIKSFDTWNHVAMSFSHANGLRLCEGGTKVFFTISMFKMNSGTLFCSAQLSPSLFISTIMQQFMKKSNSTL